jgi:Spy/CpxP family protein refolding chaperone
MKGRIIQTVSAAIILVASAGSALGQPGPPGGKGFRGPGEGFRADRIAEVLELSDEQRSQWRNLHGELRATIGPLMEERRILHQQVRTALGSDSPDSCAIGELMVGIHNIGEEQRAAHDNMREQLTSILTPEQQAKFEALHELREERWRYGPMGDRPFGRGFRHGPGWVE